LIPAFDGCDDFIRIGGPNEWFGIVVGLGNETLDGGLEIDEGSKYTALQSALAQLGKEAFDGIEPGGRFGRVVEGEAGMVVEPGPHPGVFVAAVVVEDEVDELAGRNFRLDRIEEADELLCRWRCMQRPMTLPSSTSSAANNVVVPLRL
jgi:hypothetical protein